MLVNPNCPWCDGIAEEMNHLLRDCLKTTNVWEPVSSRNAIFALKYFGISILQNFPYCNKENMNAQESYNFIINYAKEIKEALKSPWSTLPKED